MRKKHKFILGSEITLLISELGFEYGINWEGSRWGVREEGEENGNRTANEIL